MKENPIPLVNKNQIEDYIPQRSPITMIGDLVFYDDVKTITRLKIENENLFVFNNNFCEPGLVENIAQTIAVRVGYFYKEILKKDAPTGFIGAIRKLEINFLPKVGDTIYTEVEVLHEVFGVTMVNGFITCEDQIVASCEMKTVLEKET